MKYLDLLELSSWLHTEPEEDIGKLKGRLAVEVISSDKKQPELHFFNSFDKPNDCYYWVMGYINNHITDPKTGVGMKEYKLKVYELENNIPHQLVRYTTNIYLP